MNMMNWAEKEVAIACANERKGSGKKDGEWDYGCACYESALKALRSLEEDGHSGMSIHLTKNILNRLIEGKPLTPIEDTDDIWEFCWEADNKDYVNYQCKRMSSLFKKVYNDGRVIYNDVDRVTCVDINTKVTYGCGFVSRLIDDMFPITMPYYPNDGYIVYCEDFLIDPMNGDFDTFGIFYVIDPEGNKIHIDRLFGDDSDGEMKEITIGEYCRRKAQHEKGCTND